MEEIFYKGVREIKELIERREISCREVVSSFLKRIDETEPLLNAFISVIKDQSLKDAEELDKKVQRGEKLPLLGGIPVSVKDNICVKGIKTTCASKILENFTPPYDASVVRKLKENGAIIIGKSNLDEFAMGSSTENSAFGVVKNPWNLNCIPGGSSGGSAVNVSAGQVPLSLGTDTGGSIRQPASLTGVCGLKPTYGRVSRYGLIAFASSLDQIGPIARSIEDISFLFQAIGGYDEKDSTSVNIEVENISETLDKELKDVVIGIPLEFFEEGVEKDIKNLILSAVKKMEEIGFKTTEISLPNTKYCISTYYIIATAEASSNLSRYDGIRYGLRVEDNELSSLYHKTRSRGFGAEVKRRIMLGTFVLSSGYYDAYYLRAQKVRTLIKKDFEEAFKKCDCIITPTSPVASCLIGERIDDPLRMYLLDVFTTTCNLAGICGVSIPCGFSNNNMPVGLQILGKHFEDEKILRIAHKYQKITDWHKYHPEFLVKQ